MMCEENLKLNSAIFGYISKDLGRENVRIENVKILNLVTVEVYYKMYSENTCEWYEDYIEISLWDLLAFVYEEVKDEN
jgi:hypothetical protein